MLTELQPVPQLPNAVWWLACDNDHVPLYHGTAHTNLNSIASYGLHCNEGYCFLSPDYSTAQHFGSLVLHLELPKEYIFQNHVVKPDNHKYAVVDSYGTILDYRQPIPTNTRYAIIQIDREHNPILWHHYDLAFSKPDIFDRSSFINSNSGYFLSEVAFNKCVPPDFIVGYSVE